MIFFETFRSDLSRSRKKPLIREGMRWALSFWE
jgi:hypothetical protein